MLEGVTQQEKNYKIFIFDMTPNRPLASRRFQPFRESKGSTNGGVQSCSSSAYVFPATLGMSTCIRLTSRTAKRMNAANCTATLPAHWWAPAPQKVAVTVSEQFDAPRIGGTAVPRLAQPSGFKCHSASRCQRSQSWQRKLAAKFRPLLQLSSVHTPKDPSCGPGGFRCRG